MKKSLFGFAILSVMLVTLFSTFPQLGADSQGILQPNFIQGPISGSTQLKDGTVLVLSQDSWWRGNQIWKSIDQGSTWTYVSTLPGSTPLGTEKMYCTDQDSVLVADGYQGYQGHIYRSVDKGVSWTVTYLFSSKDETAWGFFEDTKGAIYAPVYSSGSTMGHSRLLRSTNDGASWQQIAAWTGYRHCHDVFVNRFNGYIYLALGDGPVALMRSKDNGQTWTNLDTIHLWSSFNGKGDSNTIYLGDDSTYSRIYRYTDDGSSSFRLQTVYDYGNSSSGGYWWLQIVNGKLVFGTSDSSAGQHAVLGVSDAGWNSFFVALDQTTTGAWQGLWPCTRSYWNITKIYISSTVRSRTGIAFQPTSSAPPVQWKLTVNSAHDSPSPSVGDHLYNDGSSVTCSVTSPTVESGVSYTCTGWIGSGSVPLSGSGTSVTFVITQNSTLTWNWIKTPTPPSQINVNITFQPINVIMHYTLNLNYLFTPPMQITLGQVTYTFSRWSDGSTSPQRTFTSDGNYEIIYS